LCSRCGACVERCPEHIIVRGDGGFPEIDFGRGECTFCGACADACPEPILGRDCDVAPWDAKAQIAGQCLAARGVFCQTCADACEPRAIRFARRMGSVPLPVVSAESCTGCGACVGSCPVGAITVDYVVSSNV
jgi:ferredoxin-type protein NapF